MDTTKDTAPPSTRVTRGIALHREHADEIERTGIHTYCVPSCTGSGSYTVYTDLRCCTCPDQRRAKEAGGRLIEHIEAHYDVREVPFGVVYRWRPECVVVECDCGEWPTLTASTTTCDACGADHEAAASEGLDDERLGDEAAHPWSYGEARGDAGLPY